MNNNNNSNNKKRNNYSNQKSISLQLNPSIKNIQKAWSPKV